MESPHRLAVWPLPDGDDSGRGHRRHSRRGYARFRNNGRTRSRSTLLHVEPARTRPSGLYRMERRGCRGEVEPAPIGRVASTGWRRSRLRTSAPFAASLRAISKQRANLEQVDPPACRARTVRPRGLYRMERSGCRGEVERAPIGLVASTGWRRSRVRTSAPFAASVRAVSKQRTNMEQVDTPACRARTVRPSGLYRMERIGWRGEVEPARKAARGLHQPR